MLLPCTPHQVNAQRFIRSKSKNRMVESHMKNFNKILVPVDESVASVKAFEKALLLARDLSAEITLLHVIPPIIQGNYKLSSPPPETRMVIAASNLIGDLRERVKNNDVKIHSMIKDGSPANEILKASEGFDLVVMGNKGRNPLSDMILGSVAEKVVRDCHLPVMLVGEKKNRGSE